MVSIAAGKFWAGSINRREPAGRHLAKARERAGMNEQIDPQKLEAVERSEARNLGSFPYLQAELQQMNDRFVVAMVAAIRAGP